MPSCPAQGVLRGTRGPPLRLAARTMLLPTMAPTLTEVRVGGALAA